MGYLSVAVSLSRCHCVARLRAISSYWHLKGSYISFGSAQSPVSCCPGAKRLLCRMRNLFDPAGCSSIAVTVWCSVSEEVDHANGSDAEAAAGNRQRGGT